MPLNLPSKGADTSSGVILSARLGIRLPQSNPVLVVRVVVGGQEVCARLEFCSLETPRTICAPSLGGLTEVLSQ